MKGGTERERPAARGRQGGDKDGEREMQIKGGIGGKQELWVLRMWRKENDGDEREI